MSLRLWLTVALTRSLLVMSSSKQLSIRSFFAKASPPLLKSKNVISVDDTMTKRPQSPSFSASTTVSKKSKPYVSHHCLSTIVNKLPSPSSSISWSPSIVRQPLSEIDITNSLPPARPAGVSLFEVKENPQAVTSITAGSGVNHQCQCPVPHCSIISC